MASLSAATKATVGPAQVDQETPPSPCQAPRNRRLLQQAGLRATTPRLLLLTALHESDHPDIEGLHRQVRAEGIALTTVYRTVETLQAAGLITATVLPSGSRIFHPADAAPHGHLVCDRCASVTDLPLTCVIDHLASGAHHVGIRLDTLHVTGQGLCHGCRHVPTGGPAARTRP